MANVLCATNNKHSRGVEDDAESPKALENRQQSPSHATDNRLTPKPASPEKAVPTEAPPSTSYSRVEKLQTQLKLPDGREFALPTCVDLALNLLLNSFDR